MVKSLENLRTLRKKAVFIDNVLCISFGSSSVDCNFMFYGGSLNFFWFFCQGRLFLAKIVLKMCNSAFFCGERLLSRLDSLFFQNFFNLFQKFLSDIFKKTTFEVNYNKSNVSHNIFLTLGLNNHNFLSNFYFKYLLKSCNSSVIGLYSLDSFDVNVNEDQFLNNFYVYQGYLANTTKVLNVDLVLPSLNFYEKTTSYYTNTISLRKSEFILTPSKVIFSD